MGLRLSCTKPSIRFLTWFLDGHMHAQLVVIDKVIFHFDNPLIVLLVDAKMQFQYNITQIEVMVSV